MRSWYFSLAAAGQILAQNSLFEPQEKCVSVDSRVDDVWCENNCACDWCPGCDQTYCEGFCETRMVDDEVTTTAPEPHSETTTQNPGPIPPNPNTNCDSPFLYNVEYLDWKVNWDDLGHDIRASIDNCYNIIMLGFYIGSENKPMDAVNTWVEDLIEAERAELLDYAHSRNAKIMLSLGGATDHITAQVASGDGVTYAKAACEYALKYGFDGVDFDIELPPGMSGPFRDGTMQQFIYDGTTECRRILGPNKLISHAPQAPYFGDWADSTLGYTQVMVDYPDLIDFVNIQYYNQGQTLYTTYENLFVAAGSWVTNTAVFEIADNGVDINKLVVGKPVGPSGYASNGYIDPKTLHDMGCQAMRQRGWNAGFMNWMYAKDSEDWITFGNEVAKGC